MAPLLAAAALLGCPATTVHYTATPYGTPWVATRSMTRELPGCVRDAPARRSGGRGWVYMPATTARTSGCHDLGVDEELVRPLLTLVLHIAV